MFVAISPFLLPFDTRLLLFFATAMDRDRALQHLQDLMHEGGAANTALSVLTTDNVQRSITPRLERRKASFACLYLTTVTALKMLLDVKHCFFCTAELYIILILLLLDFSAQHFLLMLNSDVVKAKILKPRPRPRPGPEAKAFRHTVIEEIKICSTSDRIGNELNFDCF